MKKYEITDIAHPDNPNLHRIRAVTDLTEDVLAGMLGGYVESYDNLDQEGRAWISEDSIACENAAVCGDAVLTDRAVAKGCAYVGKNATVMGDATVQDDAIVCGGAIMGKSCVCGYAVIRQDEQTMCAPIIDGSARIYPSTTLTRWSSWKLTEKPCKQKLGSCRQSVSNCPKPMMYNRSMNRSTPP